MTPDIEELKKQTKRSYSVPKNSYSTSRVKVTPKRVKTTHVRSNNNLIFGVTPDWELKELFFRSKYDPNFGVKSGVKITHKRVILYLKFLLHFWGIITPSKLLCPSH